MDSNEPDHSETSPIAPPPSRLPLIAMAALAILAVVVGIAMGFGGTQRFDDGTPEAAIQDYLQAGLDADEDAVLAALAPAQRAACRSEIYDDGLWSSRGLGFELDELRIDGDQAWATLGQRYSDSGDPFGGSSSSGTQEVELIRTEDGEWLVVEASWPWAVERCIRDMP